MKQTPQAELKHATYMVNSWIAKGCPIGSERGIAKSAAHAAFSVKPSLRDTEAREQVRLANRAKGFNHSRVAYAIKFGA